MKTGSKLFLGTAVVAGTVGITFLVLNNSFGTISPIKEINLPRAGRSITRSPSLNGNTKFEFKETIPSENTISLENNVSQFPQVKLDLDDPSYKELDVSTFKKEGAANESIQKVHSEIKTLGQLENIKDEVSESYLSILQKFLAKGKKEDIKTHISNVQDVQRQMRKLMPRNEDVNGITHSLGQEKRKSLKKIYKLYRKLTVEQNKFSKNLGSLVKDAQKAKQVRNSRSSIFEDLSPYLKKIKWSAKEINLTKEGPIKGQPYKDDWGDWKDNPFRKFYDKQEDFQKDLEEINKLIANLSKERQEVKRRDETWVGPKTEKQLLDYEKWWTRQKLENAKFLVEFKVAKKLLENIGK
ncbi:hypothetical protein OVS_01810 [Mycoplasma ovis str. Michigan]|uniref:Uncharacterized protein n=1 Tax=Mycoplasma ovis str. Michigan TaxID=1415773 RepID=A0ABM5P192_9MOLU|nr:hypothetical protein [Mycoplasma ovis]AHC40247.1 hypothetical protein OVS_01810 [Mycoplasma ovis str. Michigan]